ncbi:MAG: ribonuclease Y, partial [Veillonella sp.]|nr:ribonuclease Y [Veillonella sp.]MDU6904133.1 ribonuclease Y [Veillonella sp.]
MHKGHKKEHESSILRNKKEVKEILEYSLIAVVMVLIGLGVGYFLRKNIAEGKLNQ